MADEQTTDTPEEEVDPWPKHTVEELGGMPDLDRAKLGKHAWNKWAKGKINKNEEINFLSEDFTNEFTSFEGFVFPGNVDFTDTTFGKLTFFSDTIFHGDVDFRYVTFIGNCSFSDAIFMKEASFEGAIFNGPVNYVGSTFFTPPDFCLSTIKAHFSFHGMKIIPNYFKKRKVGIFKMASKADYVDKYRRLKELAILSKDHQKEQDFFAQELRAKRFYETNGIALIPNYLYELISDFGRSIYRPIFSMLFVWGFFGSVYLSLSCRGTQYFDQALVLSGISLSSTFGINRVLPSDAVYILFGNEIPMIVNILVSIEAVLGFLFLFLIGLALRNRFRI